MQSIEWSSTGSIWFVQAIKYPLKILPKQHIYFQQHRTHAANLELQQALCQVFPEAEVAGLHQLEGEVVEMPERVGLHHVQLGWTGSGAWAHALTEL